MALAPLAAPDDLATWLGVPASDAKLLAALRAASARFRGAVRHPVSLVSGDTVTLDGDGSSTLVLPAAPVTGVSSVLVDDVAIDDYGWSRRGLLSRDAGWPDGFGRVTVTYDHGYDPIPDDVAEAVIDQARTLYHVEPGITQVQTAAESVSFGPAASVGTTAQWASAVQAYRLNRGDEA